MAPKITSVVGWTGSRSSPAASGFSVRLGDAHRAALASCASASSSTWPPNWLRSAASTLCRVLAVAARVEAGVERGGDHRRRHVLLDGVLDRPAALARVVGVAARGRRGRCPPARRPAPPARRATSAPPSPASRGGRSWRCRARTRTCRRGRSPRRRPASARTRRRCGPSSRSGRRRSAPKWPQPGPCSRSSGGASTSRIGESRSTASSGPPTIMQ